MSTTSLSPAQKLDLSDPDKFQLASAVVKNSRSGITSHKRLLVIKKGYLYYYSNVPKKFKGDVSIVQTIHQLPKCSIQIVNIKQIKGYQSNSSYFSIEFQSRNMLQRQDIRKTMTLEQYNFSPKHTTQTIVWQFTCDNQFIKQRWVAALQGLQQHYTKEKKDIQKFFNQNSNMSQMKSSSSGGRDSRVPWRESQSGHNNSRGSYKRYGEVSFLQLVGTKSSDQRQKSKQKYQNIQRNSGNKSNENKNGPLSSMNKTAKTDNNSVNYLNIPQPNNINKPVVNFQLRNQVDTVYKINNSLINSNELNIRNNDLENDGNNNKSKQNAFMMQSQSYSSQSESSINNDSKKSPEIDRQIRGNVSINREGNSIYSSETNNNNNNNSPIKGLQFSQIIERQQSKQQQNKLSQSKTSIVKISHQQQNDYQQYQKSQKIVTNEKEKQITKRKVNQYNRKQQKQVGQRQFYKLNRGDQLQQAREFEMGLLKMEEINGRNVGEQIKYNHNLVTKQNTGKQSNKTVYFSNQQVTNNKKNKNNNQYQQQHIHSSNYNPNHNNQQQIKQHINYQSQQFSQKSFYQLHKFVFSNNLTFSQRIQVQKQFHFRLHQFTTQSTKKFIHYVDALTKDHSDQLLNKMGFDLLYQTNNMRLLRHKPSQTLYKIAFVTSQPLTINSQQKLYFDQQPIKNLKRQFKLINDLQKYIILPQVKNNHIFKLRVPLSVLVQYKGVVGLIIDQKINEFQQDQNKNNDIDSIGQAITLNKQTRTKYQRQFDALTSNNYDLKDFLFTSSNTCTSQKNNDNYIILHLLPQIVKNKSTTEQIKKTYLKKILSVKQPTKHHNIEFNPPFTHKVIKKAKLNYASTSLQSLEFYLTTLSNIVGQFPSSSESLCSKQQIMEFLQSCLFVKQLRKLYRSAQGQVEETHFFSLVFGEDNNGMKEMLGQAGCNTVPKMTGLILDLIEYFMGVTIKVDVKRLALLKQQEQKQSKTNKSILNNSKPSNNIAILSTQCKPIIHFMDLSRLQIEQAFNSIGRFLSQNNTLLAKNAINIISTIQYELFPMCLYERMLQLTYYKAQLAYIEKDYLTCVQASNHFTKMVGNVYSPRMFQTYLLMLKAYTHISSDEFLLVYDGLLEMIRFNYGEQSSVLIGVYSVGGFLLRGMVVSQGQVMRQQQRVFKQANRDKQTIIDNNKSMLIFGSKLMQEGQRLCKKLFGQQSQQYIELLLDMVRFHSTIDEKKQQLYYRKVRQLISVTNNRNKLIDCFILQLRRSITHGDNSKINNNQSNSHNQHNNNNKMTKFDKSLSIIEHCQNIIMMQTTIINHNLNGINKNNQQPPNINYNNINPSPHSSKLSTTSIKQLISLQSIKFTLGMKHYNNQTNHLIEHAILMLWQTHLHVCRQKAVIMIAKYLTKTDSLEKQSDYHSYQQQQQNSQYQPQYNTHYVNQSTTTTKIQSLINSVLQLLLLVEQNHSSTTTKGQNIIIKTKKMIEQQQLLSNKNNPHSSLTYMLTLISKQTTLQ